VSGQDHPIEGRCGCPEGGRYVCRSGDIFDAWLHMDGWECLSAANGVPVIEVSRDDVLRGDTRRRAEECASWEQLAAWAVQAGRPGVALWHRVT